MRTETNSIDKTRCFQILLVIAVFALVIYRIHVPMTILSDDQVNIDLGVNFGNFFSFIIERYYHIGKYLTDGFAFLLYCIPFDTWKIIDTGVYVVILILLWDMFTDRSVKMLIATAIGINMFPIFMYMYSAGFIMTSTNYIYTFIALLLAFYPLVRMINGMNIPYFIYIFSALGLIYASNQDQSTMINVGGFLLAGIVYWINWKRNNCKESLKIAHLCLIYFVASVILLIIFLSSPGHIERMTTPNEMKKFLPQFEYWSPVEKLSRGMSTTFAHIFFQKPALVSWFCALITGLTYLYNRKKAAVPMLLLTMIWVCNSLQICSPYGHDIFIKLYDYSFNMADLISIHTNPIPSLLSVIMFILMITSVAIIYPSDKKLSITMFILNILGFGSRFMMGFSPTLFASSYRTFTYQLFFFLICDLLMLTTIFKRITLLTESGNE